ncbi:MAG: PAS domain S-box protein [Bryobacterales bacterium]|nr:PAS domain S-box protein [Bryobacterales bacterium]
MHSIAIRPIWQKLVVLVCSVAIAVVAGDLSQHYLGDQFETTFGLLAVVVSGIFGGARFGLLAAVCAGFLTNFASSGAPFLLTPPTLSTVIALAIFLAIAVIVVAIIHQLQHYAANLERKERALRLAQEEGETERLLRRAAESHYAREAIRFETVLSGILDAVVSVDREGLVRFANAAALDFSGLTIEDCLGKPISEMWAIESAATGERIEQLVLTVLRTGTGAREAGGRLLVSKGNRPRDVSVSAAPVRDEAGALVGAVSILRDTTETRVAERKLKDYEQRFRLATDAANIGVWVWNPETDAAFWNRNLAHMLGLGDSEYEGSINAFYARVAPHERGPLQETILSSVKSGKPFYREFLLAAEAGERTWLAGAGAGVYDEKTGKIRFMAGVSLDISDRKAAEERIRDLNESLAESANHLQRANRDLQERTRQLESILSERTAFLSSMSHELRTPLHSISGFLELLFEDPESEDLNERQRRFLGNIASSTQHLIRVVNDVLDLSRISAGRLRLNLEQFDLHGVAEAVVTSLLPIARDQDVDLTLLQTAHPSLIADPERIRQILTNLVSNAIKYTPAGGRVTVMLGQAEERIFAEVEDTGIGICEEDLERIFGEFEQVHHPTFRPKLRGSGLGLAITRKLVEMQGGRIEVESAPGKGSRFRISFPVEPRTSPDAAPPEE